jgi:hypothetical protein
MPNNVRASIASDLAAVNGPPAAGCPVKRTARELANRAGHTKPSMSLDIYSHVIVPDEVNPEVLKALVIDETVAKRRTRDAPVIHRPTS